MSSQDSSVVVTDVVRKLAFDDAVLGGRIASLLTGRLPHESIHCVVGAFSAAASGDIAKADELSQARAVVPGGGGGL